MDELLKPQTFRDTVSTVDKEGHRKWIHALQPKGTLYNIRTYISWIYLALFFSIPFIKIKGIPFLQLNIIERRFIFFGKIFTPDDFFIFAVGMITFIVFVVLFTIIFGRLFCGWVCPQTIFMEMVFRKIEYWIEGSANDQKVLDRSEWNYNKIIRKGGKHLAFFILSFIIANIFLSYIIGIDNLLKYIKEPFYEHITLLLGLIFFTFLFYAVYAFVRELACIVVCPYGRLQSVLLDKDTIVVAYDYIRGEPRQKIHKNEQRNTGDCIDCHQCVAVCPTGIDIRNGTQMECTNCTACIDVCNFMMQKVGLPKNLIQYASENNIAENKKLQYTTRMKAYTVVLSLLIGLMVFLLITRKNIDAHITKVKGQLYTKMEGNKLANFYEIKILNKTNKDVALDIKLEDTEGEIKLIGAEKIKAKSLQQGKAIFMIILNEKKMKKHSIDIKVGLYDKNKRIETIQSNFLGPYK